MQVIVDKLYKAITLRFFLSLSLSSFLHTMTIQDDNNKNSEAIYPVPSRLLAGGNCPTPHVVGMDQYKKMWEESINDPDTFFSKASIDHDRFFLLWHLISCSSWHKTC